MNIYAYNLPVFMHQELTNEFNNLIFIQNTEKLHKKIKSEDKFICMWDDDSTLEKIEILNNELFPKKEIVRFSANREKMTRFVNQHSMFKAEREYLKFDGLFTVTVPKLTNSLNVVVKIGEEHRGQNKELMYPGQQLTVKDSVVFEEFIDNAKSYRVLLIGEEVFIVDYKDDPDNPKSLQQEWIKNLNPILNENPYHELFEEEIKDTINLSKKLGFDYLGVDYVKNEEKIVCLEANVFPGVRLNKRTKNAAMNYWKKKIGELTKSEISK